MTHDICGEPPTADPAENSTGNDRHPLSDPTTFQFNLPEKAWPKAVPLSEKWYPGARTVARTCTSRRAVPALQAVRAIVVHATAGSSSEGAFSVMRARRASFHWLVPGASEEAHGALAWATAPETRAAWHVANRCSHPDVAGGAKRINHISLGIEVVNRQDGREPFTDWQVQMTADIVRYAWAKYPNLVHVVSHAKLDPERRTDPGATFPWDQFRALILQRSEVR
ncbi:MAG: N-acetylmuramoyl-L-alanine amidase [Pseudomonadota bacterium]